MAEWYIKKALLTNQQGFLYVQLRRVGDSNPRTLSQVNSFQDCRNRPLCQLSTAKVQIRRETANPDSIFLAYLF